MKTLGLLFVLNVLSINSIMAQEVTNIFTHKIGTYEVTLLSEGQQNGKPNILIGATSEMLNKYIPNGTFPNATNTFLIKGNGKIILIDTGYGRNLFDNMKSLNVNAEQVDAVLITHMHGDHIGGLLRDGKIAFPNAELLMTKTEYDYWLNASNQNIHNIFSIYKNKIRLFTPAEINKPATSVLTDVYGIAAYGHTPGHTAFLLESNNEKLLIWGDLTHAMAIQMPHPEIAVTYDTNPKVAIKSRQDIFEYVTVNKIPIAGMHIAYPAIGNVTKNDSGEGFLFVPFK
ncbi:MAG: MBL fold metallo-hydrolase [Cytophagaceae bacterium]|jgi:glyoxylase-like metal-dependent hydrolase (beta-lactamase superfamily II)|nr:MBL fold metallo-hydrolase [Cytophagaceae bacterium]